MLPLFLLACASPPPKQPDIVLVVVDTLRADHLGAYGYARPTSPNIDRLASQGALFTRAYAHASWTLASFASLLSGQYPHQHRVVRGRQNQRSAGQLSHDTVTLPEALQQAGYATAAFVNNVFLSPDFALDQGFDVYNWNKGTNKLHRPATDTVRLGLDWLGQQQKPAFLMLHFMEPHLSYDPPADLRGTFAPRDNPPVPIPFLASGFERSGPTPEPALRDFIVGLYDEEVLGVDRAVGQLVAGLEAADALKDTLLVLTADHGEELWDHGGFEHGHTLHGELVRVPLIVAGAGAPTGRFETVVEQVDLFQGLIAQGKAARPAGTAGEDLWALAAKPPTETRYALSESVFHGPDLASVADRDARLVIALEDHLMEAWAIDVAGQEREPVGPLDQEETGRRLFRQLFDRRGGLEPIEVRQGTREMTPETEAALQALGYLESP